MYVFHGGNGFSVGAIPCGCPLSLLFWSTVGESFLYGSTTRVAITGFVIFGRPRGSPLRGSLYSGWRLGSPLRGSFQWLGLLVQFLKWRGNGLALQYMRAIGYFGNVGVILPIRFQLFSLHRSLSLSHFQYVQIYMPCYGNKWLWNTILIVHNHILSDEYCGGDVWQGYSY